MSNETEADLIAPRCIRLDSDRGHDPQYAGPRISSLAERANLLAKHANQLAAFHGASRNASKGVQQEYS